ncbi:MULTISPECIES: hypothetical protein [unclassified Streptomyces]|uniref:hypothetical protein n=1 Tax=unclassified Streptomyces TaxID=2593676 RepID=UPI000A1E3FD1|nr:hypothetical protein B7767_24785 [Streptomyces sp. 13-12-16]
MHGYARAARGVPSPPARGPRTAPDTRSADGRTGLVVRPDRQAAAVTGVGTADHHVVRVRTVLAPGELRRWNRRRP